MVLISAKQIEISNPGPLYEAAPLNNVMRAPAPRRRNNWLYHQLVFIDPKKRFTRYNRGVQRIKQLTNGIGKVKFINMRKRNLFKVLLPGVDAVKK